MIERPCGDITCDCCYPQCYCDGQPQGALPGTIHACDDCGRVTVADANTELPDYVRRHVDYAEAAVARYHAERGTTPPEQPTVVWRELAPATRIPGSA